jgi:hypothetical protein
MGKLFSLPELTVSFLILAAGFRLSDIQMSPEKADGEFQNGYPCESL